jgi:hypothetical protein
MREGLIKGLLIPGTLFLAVSIFLVSQTVLAKSPHRPKVESIVDHGICYVPDYVPVDTGKDLSGGYVQAWDTKKNLMLWKVRVYKLKPKDPDAKKDPPDLFITSLKLKKGVLFLTAGDFNFTIDIKTHKVKQTQQVAEKP